MRQKSQPRLEGSCLPIAPEHSSTPSLPHLHLALTHRDLHFLAYNDFWIAADLDGTRDLCSGSIRPESSTPDDLSAWLRRHAVERKRNF
jgi:hypothetical protein